MFTSQGAFVTEDQTANQGMNQLPLSASTASFGSKKSDIPTGHDHGSHIVQTCSTWKEEKPAPRLLLGSMSASLMTLLISPHWEAHGSGKDDTSPEKEEGAKRESAPMSPPLTAIPGKT